jgi:hypothetical protein
VRLDVADRLRLDHCRRQSLFDDARLPFHARRGITDFERTVVVDRRAFDHGLDRIAVGQRIGQTLQHDNPDAASLHRPCGLRVEGATMPVGRDDAALLIDCALSLRHADRDAARERHIAFLIEQALAGHVHRHQRG